MNKFFSKYGIFLLALNVPAGEHKIHFVFDPDSVKKGNILSSVCAIWN